MEFEAITARRQADWERDTILAYQGVRIYITTMNDGKMPGLRSLLEPHRRQTPAEQRSAVELLAAQFGWKKRKRVTSRG